MTKKINLKKRPIICLTLYNVFCEIASILIRVSGGLLGMAYYGILQHGL